MPWHIQNKPCQTETEHLMKNNRIKATKSIVIILLVITLIVGFIGSSPMSEKEALSYIQKVKEQKDTPGARHNLNELTEFLLSDDGKPFYTVNLYKFNDIAKYEPSEKLKLSGEQAYKLFSDEMIKLLISNSSYPIFASNWLNYSNKGWDRIVIVRYANRRAIAEIFSNDKFSLASKHKWASIAKHDRFIVQAIHLPELTLVLLMLCIFFVAAYLLVSLRRP